MPEIKPLLKIKAFEGRELITSKMAVGNLFTKLAATGINKTIKVITIAGIEVYDIEEQKIAIATIENNAINPIITILMYTSCKVYGAHERLFKNWTDVLSPLLPKINKFNKEYIPIFKMYKIPANKKVEKIFAIAKCLRPYFVVL